MKRIIFIILAVFLIVPVSGQTWTSHSPSGIMYSDPTIPDAIILTPSSVAVENATRVDVTIYDSIGHLVHRVQDIQPHSRDCAIVFEFNMKYDGWMEFVIYHPSEYDSRQTWCYTLGLYTKRHEEKIMYFLTH